MSSRGVERGCVKAAREHTTWEGNARWRAEQVLKALPEERLRWLEAALELADRAGALPSHRICAGFENAPEESR